MSSVFHPLIQEPTVASHSNLQFRLNPSASPKSEAAEAYDYAGVHYAAYADGAGEELFDFDRRYAFGDRRIWAAIDARLTMFARTGRNKLRVLDAGCGPGTWLRRIIARAKELGIQHVEARGFDISGEQVAIARMRAADVRSKLGVQCRFEHGDIMMPFAEATSSVDLCLCLNGVLNHVAVVHHAAIVAELARVTAGALIVNVRSAGSTPSIFVDAIENARDFRQDNINDRLAIDLIDGHHIEFGLHLFRASELTALFDGKIVISNLIGLDLFHSRFRPDPRWNTAEVAETEDFYRKLEALEQAHNANPAFIDHATHILLVAEPELIMEG